MGAHHINPMMIAIPRPAFMARLPWPIIALGGASILAALYLADGLTGVARALYYSVIGLPVLGLLMILPTALALGAAALVVRRLLPWPAVALLTLVPLLGWSAIYAPSQRARILSVAADDGGTLPAFERDDVLAVVDRTSSRFVTRGVCDVTCVEILRSGHLGALFLPRHAAPGNDAIYGVIYRRATWGRDCDRELAPKGARPLCVSETPGTLWDVTHVLESYELPPTAPPGEPGVHEGFQVRLTHRYSGEVLLQRTSLVATVPSRLPLFGDLRLAGDDPSVTPRMTTTTVERPWRQPPLLDMVRERVERRAAGLE